MVLKCKNLKLHIGSCCISNFGTAETSNDAISNGFRCWRYGKSYCQGRTAGYRFRSSRSGCRRWGRWSWGRRGRPTGLDGGGLLLGLPVGIGRLGGFRGLIPFGLLGTLRLIAIGAHRLIWRISPVATPWGQGAPLSSKRIANFMIPPQKCLDVRASIRLKSIVDGQKI